MTSPLSVAREIGQARYFTGIPCSRGHVCECLTANATCVECQNLKNSRRYSESEIYRRKTRARMQDRYRLDPQKFRDRSNERYKSDPQSFRAHSANTRARFFGAEGVITGEDIAATLSRQKFQCACGVDLHAAYEIDHKIRLSNKGPNTRRNLQCLCVPCHRIKTDNERRR